ncbi:MAG: hypothetical protein CMJ31_04825 [Phycisphaerae bacterium]|nr:hypothetical protein [Phycisphaerae bacterium]
MPPEAPIDDCSQVAASPRPLSQRRGVAFAVIVAGGLMLTFSAGFVNAVALGVAGRPVTHVTGAVSRLSTDLGNGDAVDAKRAFLLIGSFAAGAVLSGLVIGKPSVRLTRRYGLLTMAAGALLGGAAAVFVGRPIAGAMLASMAAGVQNAMASSYGGLIVRTTHVTGVLTDLGFLIGQTLRGRRTPMWKPALLTGLFGAFFGGGVGRAIAQERFGAAAMYGPAATLIVAGAMYAAWRVARQRMTGSSEAGGQSAARR